MIAQSLQPLGQLPIIGRDKAAVPQGVQVLQGMGGETPGLAKSAAGLAMIGRADRLGRVLDDHQAVLLSQSAKGVHLAQASGQVDRHDRLGAGGDGPRNGLRIDVLVRPHIGEDRCRPHMDDGGGRSDEGVGRRDHLIARPYAQRLEGEDEGVGSGLQGHDMGDADVCGELGLQ